jgi:hypothetical protein
MHPSGQRENLVPQRRSWKGLCDFSLERFSALFTSVPLYDVLRYDRFHFRDIFRDSLTFLERRFQSLSAARARFKFVLYYFIYLFRSDASRSGMAFLCAGFPAAAFRVRFFVNGNLSGGCGVTYFTGL